MPSVPAPSQISDADFEAIESAVMETVRGRWFLAEYARRNRHAETERLLEVLNRIERRIEAPQKPAEMSAMHTGVMEMAHAIARTRAEIAAIKPPPGGEGHFGDATEELDAIVTATERATGDILQAAEQIQELAWTLRERGSECQCCDTLDERATEIYTACSFQDLTGQRTRKVIAVLHYLEARINAMVEIWGIDLDAVRAAAEQSRLEAAFVPSLALRSTQREDSLAQDSVDAMLDEPAPPTAQLPDPLPVDDIVAIDVAEPSLAPSAEQLAPIGDNEGTVEELVALDVAQSATVSLDPAATDGDGRRMHVVVSAAEPASVRLTTAELDALSSVERIALFS